MATVEVKRVRSTMTIDDKEPHWIAVVDYGRFEVEIPLPARYLPGDDARTQRRQFVEAMEILVELCFAMRIKLEHKGLTIGTDLVVDSVAHGASSQSRSLPGGLMP
jgi:hypothetical protein